MFKIQKGSREKQPLKRSFLQKEWSLAGLILELARERAEGEEFFVSFTPEEIEWMTEFAGKLTGFIDPSKILYVAIHLVRRNFASNICVTWIKVENDAIRFDADGEIAVWFRND